MRVYLLVGMAFASLITTEILAENFYCTGQWAKSGQHFCRNINGNEVTRFRDRWWLLEKSIGDFSRLRPCGGGSNQLTFPCNGVPELIKDSELGCSEEPVLPEQVAFKITHHFGQIKEVEYSILYSLDGGNTCSLESLSSSTGISVSVLESEIIPKFRDRILRGRFGDRGWISGRGSNYSITNLGREAYQFFRNDQRWVKRD